MNEKVPPKLSEVSKTPEPSEIFKIRNNLNDELDLLYGVIQGACNFLNLGEDKGGQDLVVALENQFGKVKDLTQESFEVK